jgi:hypothetical protein
MHERLDVGTLRTTIPTDGGLNARIRVESASACEHRGDLRRFS